jgi:hypothetical protein
MSKELEEIKARNAELEDRIAKLEEAAKPPEPFVPMPRIQFDPTEGASMPPSALREMMKAVPDALMRELRADARRPNPVTEASSSPVTTSPSAQSQPTQRGTGWVPERSFPDRTKEFELVDRIVASQVGGPNDPVK